MDELQETEMGVSTYGFYVWESQIMTVIANRCDEFWSKNTSQQNRKETKAHTVDDMEIVEVPVIDIKMRCPTRTAPLLVFFLFNASVYNQADLFVSIEEIEERYVSLHHTLLSQVILSLAISTHEWF